MSIENDSKYIRDLNKFDPSPPVVSYFQVTFFPGYLNAVKLAKLLINSVTHLRLEELIAFGAMFGFGVEAKGNNKPNKDDSEATKEYEARKEKYDSLDDDVPSILAGIGKSVNIWDFRFNKVSGLSSTIETDDIRIGGFNTEMLQLPGRVVHPNLVLERAFVTESRSLLSKEFHVAMNSFLVLPGEIMVSQNSPDGTPQAAWLFRNAYPVGWSNSDLHSDDNGIFMEKMEFAYSHRHQLEIGNETKNIFYV